MCCCACVLHARDIGTRPLAAPPLLRAPRCPPLLPGAVSCCNFSFLISTVPDHPMVHHVVMCAPLPWSNVLVSRSRLLVEYSGHQPALCRHIAWHLEHDRHVRGRVCQHLNRGHSRAKRRTPLGRGFRPGDLGVRHGPRHVCHIRERARDILRSQWLGGTRGAVWGGLWRVEYYYVLRLAAGGRAGAGVARFSLRCCAAMRSQCAMRCPVPVGRPGGCPRLWRRAPRMAHFMGGLTRPGEDGSVCHHHHHRHRRPAHAHDKGISYK